MIDKNIFINQVKAKLYHKNKIKLIKVASKEKLKLPKIPEPFEKSIFEEIDLSSGYDSLE